MSGETLCYRQTEGSCGHTFRRSADSPPHRTSFYAWRMIKGWGDVGYNGHPVLQTPNLDAMASASLRFDRFYAATPTCSPTRGSVLTGRHPHRYGCLYSPGRLPADEISIATLLRQAGYATGHFGKWGLGDIEVSAPTGPASHGFDTWVSNRLGFNRDPFLSRNGEPSQYSGEGSMVLVDAALDFIRQQTGQRTPFLAVVWFSSCHSPHVASATDRAIYADQPEEVQQFYGEITAMDRAIGKLRNELRTLGISENTILWFCSDNGGLPELGSTGGRGYKHLTYEGGLRVPGLLEWPDRIKKGRRSSIPAVTSDIAPTLLAIANVPRPQDREIDGVSLLPLIDGETFSRPPIGFWSARDPEVPWPIPRRVDPDNHGQSAWLDWPWKLHKRLTAEYRVELSLYNLASDPYEEHNVAAQQPWQRFSMRQQLETWQASVLLSMETAAV